jgi:hypothetical protein
LERLGMVGSDRKGGRDEAQPDDADIARRRDEALGRLLKMPPKPHEKMKLGRPRRKPTGAGSSRSVTESDDTPEASRSER